MKRHSHASTPRLIGVVHTPSTSWLSPTRNLGSNADSIPHGCQAPVGTPISGLEYMPDRTILKGPLWNKLTSVEFRTRIRASPRFGLGSPAHVYTPQSRASSDVFRSPIGTFPLNNTPVSQNMNGIQTGLRPSDLLRAFSIAQSTPPTSARTDTSVERMYPETPLCEDLCTDSLVIEAEMIKDVAPEVIAATERLVEGVNFLRKLYAASSRSSPVCRDVWSDGLSQVPSADNAFEQAVSAQLQILREQLEGEGSPQPKRQSSICSRSPSLEESWYKHVKRLRLPGPLKFEGPGDLKEILSGGSRVSMHRDPDCQVIEDANGGKTVVDSLHENMHLIHCYSTNITISGSCKSLRIDDCDNCTICVDDVAAPVWLHNCRKVQLIFKGTTPSVIVD